MSGWTVAKCKECNCVFDWTLDNFPFVDSEIIGTCDKCLNKETHECVNETQDFAKVGIKTFEE